MGDLDDISFVGRGEGPCLGRVAKGIAGELFTSYLIEGSRDWRWFK